MQNKEHKKTLIKDGVFKEYQKQQYEVFNATKGDLNLKNEALKFIFNNDYNDLKQLSEAKKKQASKIKKHLYYWLHNKRENENIYFLTFTYDDAKRRKEIKEEILKKYVIKALKLSNDYIINIDYGEQNERIHFHGLALINDEFIKDKYDLKTLNHNHWHTIKNYKFTIFEEYENKVGIITAERIKTTDKDLTKIGRYMSKLISHSIKVKQTYISTKKGTTYQKHKKALESYLKVRNQNLNWNEKINNLIQF